LDLIILNILRKNIESTDLRINIFNNIPKHTFVDFSASSLPNPQNYYHDEDVSHLDSSTATDLQKKSIQNINFEFLLFSFLFGSILSTYIPV